MDRKNMLDPRTGKPFVFDRPRVFIGGPYRAETLSEVRCNIEAARVVGEVLLAAGFDIYVPHTHTGMMDGIVPDEVFLDMALRELIETHFDLFVALPGWEHSEGTKTEMTTAHWLAIETLKWKTQQFRITELWLEEWRKSYV